MLLLLRSFFAMAGFRPIQALLVASFTLLSSGCAMMSNTTTLKIETPANVTVMATAQYSELFRGVCFLPEDYAGDPEPDKKRFSTVQHPRPFTTGFEVQIAYTVEDCFLALSGIDFMIQATAGADGEDFDFSTVALDVETYLKDDEELSTRIDEQVLQVRCHWRDPEPGRPLKRRLQCSGLDANGNELKGQHLGMLKNRQLQGLVLRLKVDLADSTQVP